MLERHIKSRWVLTLRYFIINGIILVNIVCTKGKYNSVLLKREKDWSFPLCNKVYIKFENGILGICTLVIIHQPLLLQNKVSVISDWN